MKGLVGLVALAVLAVWGYNAFLKPDSWQGMYEVPDGTSIGVVKFESKEECQNWLEEPYYYAPSDAYNFECGSNCKPPTSSLGLYVCEETLD